MDFTGDERTRLLGCLDPVLLELMDHPLLGDATVLNFEAVVQGAPNLKSLLEQWVDPFVAMGVLQVLAAFCQVDPPQEIYGIQPGETRLCQGNVVVKGDLHLMEGATIFVLGDLHIDGHYTDGSTSHLFVHGQMRAASVRTQGDLVVKGDLTVDTVIFAFHNDGTLWVDGATQAQLVMIDKHLSIVDAGATPLVSTESSGDWHESLRAVVADRFIAQDGTVDAAEVARVVVSGQPVLRDPEIRPWQHASGYPAKLKTLGEAIVASHAVGDVVFLCTQGEHGNASTGRVWCVAPTGWSEVRTAGPTCSGILVRPSGEILLAARSGTLVRSHDQGQTWVEQQLAEGTLGTLAENSNGLYVGGAKGLVMRSDDDGTTWQVLEPQVTGVFRRPLTAAVLDLFCGDDQVFLCTANGGIFRSDDQGANWKQLSTGVSTRLLRMVRVAERLVVVGDCGVVLTSDDGEAWHRQEGPTLADINDVVVGNRGQLFAVSSDGEVLASKDGVQ